MNIEFEDFSGALDAVNELLADRSWHANEPRCGYAGNYEALKNLGSRMREQFEAQLPTAEDVQRCFREAANPQPTAGMKTAEEHAQELTVALRQEWFGTEDAFKAAIASMVKAIQLDAFKAGMTEAAEIANDEKLEDYRGGSTGNARGTRMNIAGRIIYARDAKTL